MIGRTERSMGETPFFSNKTSSSNIECVYVIVIVELSRVARGKFMVEWVYGDQ